MPVKQIRPYGSWPSPISANLLTQGGVRLGMPFLDADASWWLESRPSESGRTVLVRKPFEGAPMDVTPQGFSVRSKANEYGGGDYHVSAPWIFFVNADNQQVYRQSLENLSQTPEQITCAVNCRFADLCFDPHRQQLIAVQERLIDGDLQSVHSLVAININDRSVFTLIDGADFYASPSLSPCGNQLTWLSWNHPDMPWDNNQLWLANQDAAGQPQGAHCISPKKGSSFQPIWSDRGELICAHDGNDWWNLTTYQHGQWHPIATMDAEFATPQWVFGMSCYGFVSARQLFVSYSRQGEWQCGLVNIDTGSLDPIDSKFSDISDIRCCGGQAVMLAAGHSEPAGVWRFRDGNWVCDKKSVHNPIDANNLSKPQALTFATSDNDHCHGFYYPPTNTQYQGSPDEHPPLIVISHGGPTGATSTALNFKTQYWTSRGFAVLDVNYRGSTGYGRRYRNSLKGKWGVYDLDDVCAGADYLVQQGLADPNRLIIKGSSAGGYTVLAALTFRDTFCAGTSLYGIGDLTTLATDTHKFESHYLDSLVAPWPAGEPVYRARSPLFHVEQLNCPVIFFQGLEDKVVPPNQAQAMVSALTNKKVQTAYITFAGEGHGFRQAQSIVDQLELELNFYGALFNFSVQPSRADFNFEAQS